jgi:guanylate kinase
MKTKGRLIILSGPSCVGKGSLCQALETFYPDLYYNMQRLVLYNSRDKRPGEREGVDYYFRSREQMESMRKGENFILLNVRGDLQGLDLQELLQLLDKGKDVLFEGNPFIPQALWNNPALSSIIMQKVFLSPISREEILWLKARKADPGRMVVDVMRRKLLRRTQRQKGILSMKELENIEERCKSAPEELRLAFCFDWVIPNHDGEDSENWNLFGYPIGDAFKSLQAFVLILQGQNPSAYAEKWEKELWPL